MRDRGGFSLIELVLVMMVGGLLATVAFNSFGEAQHRMGVRSAHSQFLSMHAQTRALAVERGLMTRLVIDADQNRVTVLLGAGGGSQTIRSVDFMEAHNVEIQAAGSSFELCMNPRGFGDLNCTNFPNPVDVTFRRRGQERTVRLLPLGQVLR